MPHRLDGLAEEISECRRCDRKGIPVLHTSPMRRGEGDQILVVGVSPGKTEIERAEAFVGAAGKRLMEWLAIAGIGATREEILSRCYLTSLCKCYCAKDSYLPAMIDNCLPFLYRQISLVGPAICVTLGRRPLEVLFGYKGLLDDAIGQVLREDDFGEPLFRVLPNHAAIIPLPHPSPLSRWLNNDQNRARLNSALAHIEELLNA